MVKFSQEMPLQDKTALITGANAGIGKITARELARLGARVIMVCRNAERGEKARQEIIEASGNPEIKLMLADLAEPDEVRRLAENFKNEYSRLDVLINNAGIMPGKFQLNSQEQEISWATNYLAGFLLTNLLMDELLAAGPARIINLSSEAHRLGQINFQDLGNPDKYNAFTAYCDSKLANILFTYELARRLELTEVMVNSVHPGMIATDFARQSNPGFRLLFNLGRPFMASPEKGAQTPVFLASSPEIRGVSGKYFKKKKPVKSSDLSYDHSLARRLWMLSEAQTGFQA